MPSTGATPPPVRAWVATVLALGLVGAGANLALGPGSIPDPLLALVLAAGVAATSLVSLRYRFGGSTHAVTADEAVLAAMLVSLPTAWVPVLLVGGVVAGNLARRRPRPMPAVRVAFNAGSAGLAAALGSLLVWAWVGPVAPGVERLAADRLLAVAVALATYGLVQALLIAVLFQRLGVSPLRQGIAEVLPVSRVTFPVGVAAGLVLGWLAVHGPLPAVLGTGILVALLVGLRAGVAVRQIRQRSARLRDVAMALVAASGSLEAFDRALEEIADLFGASSAELLLRDRPVRRVGSQPVDVEGPSAAARHALVLGHAVTLAPGTPEGGPDGAVAAPLRASGGDVVGALVLHARRGLEPWDDADEDTLAGVASEVLVALRNAELVDELAAERSRLRAQTGLLGGIFDAVSDGVAMVDAGGVVLAWNPGLAELAAVSAREAVGRPWQEVLELADERGSSERIGADLAQAAAGATLARTWRLQPAGSRPERWVRVVLTPVTDPQQPGAVLVLRDVTGAREVDRVKADFIATVSHELRTPLTPLKGFIELADRRELDEDMQAEMRKSMRRQLQRLESLIDDLLSIAELDRDLVDLGQVEVPLEPLLVRLRVVFGDEVDGRLRIEPTALAALGDVDAIDRILVALTSNALKHTEGPVVVRADTEGADVVVEVVDEGPGIPIGEQEAVFERFHRLGDHLHRTQGPGLGLPIARALARRLHGEVEVESGSERGSTFRVRLPLAGSAVARREAEVRPLAG